MISALFLPAPFWRCLDRVKKLEIINCASKSEYFKSRSEIINNIGKGERHCFEVNSNNGG